MFVSGSLCIILLVMNVKHALICDATFNFNLHHKKYSRHDKSRVGGIAKYVPNEGRKILIYSLHDYVVHLLLAAASQIK